MMGTEKFEDALDQCLDMLQSGASIDECVARYPEHADELRTQLNFARSLEDARPDVQPESTAQAQGRSRLLTDVGEQRSATASPWAGLLAPIGAVLVAMRWRLSLLPQAMSAVLAVLVLSGAALGVSAATTGSLDPTEPVRDLFVSSHEDDAEDESIEDEDTIEGDVGILDAVCDDLEDEEAEDACEDALDDDDRSATCQDLDDPALVAECSDIVAGATEVCADVTDEITLELCEEATDDAEDACDDLSHDARHACEDALDAVEDAAEGTLDLLDDACDDLEGEAEEACEDALDDDHDGGDEATEDSSGPDDGSGEDEEAAEDSSGPDDGHDEDDQAAEDSSGPDDGSNEDEEAAEDSSGSGDSHEDEDD